MRKVYVKSVCRLKPSEEPDYSSVLSPMAARRMGPVLKKAVWTSVNALKSAGLDNVDAIITATDYGCIGDSEAFLKALNHVDGLSLRPTNFMQSTHNTISSLIAIHIGCHGYNATYSHYGNSFNSALMDAWIQISLGDIDTALVGQFDEVTDLFKVHLADKGRGVENTAVSYVLTGEPEGVLYELLMPKIC